MIIGFFYFNKDELQDRPLLDRSTTFYEILIPYEGRFGWGLRINVLNKCMFGGYITTNIKPMVLVTPPPPPEQSPESPDDSQLPLPFDQEGDSNEQT
jgi:hypothetical protein